MERAPGWDSETWPPKSPVWRVLGLLPAMSSQFVVGGEGNVGGRRVSWRWSVQFVPTVSGVEWWASDNAVMAKGYGVRDTTCRVCRSTSFNTF